MSKKEVQISPTLIGFIVLLVLVGPILLRCVKTVDPGYVSVATFFGEVQKETYGPGLHFPVNPLLSFTEFDVRNKEHKERIGVPSQDQLTTGIDVLVKYHIDGNGRKNSGRKPVWLNKFFLSISPLLCVPSCGSREKVLLEQKISFKNKHKSNCKVACSPS